MTGSMARAFAKCAEEALHAFPNTIGQCVGLCAAVSMRLTEEGVPNKVALGSLSCWEVPAFLYSGPFVANASAPVIWEGHAWIEFPGGIIGEPSLLRTARAAERESNLRRAMERLGLIDKGAFLMPEDDALEEFGLRYMRMAHLAEAEIGPLVRGLIAANDVSS